MFFQNAENPDLFESPRGEFINKKENKGRFIYEDVANPGRNTPLENRSPEVKEQPENLWSKKPLSSRGNLSIGSENQRQKWDAVPSSSDNRSEFTIGSESQRAQLEPEVAPAKEEIKKKNQYFQVWTIARWMQPQKMVFL